LTKNDPCAVYPGAIFARILKHVFDFFFLNAMLVICGNPVSGSM
jgi:hypothetical protein